jgi:hypothetical protein
METTLRLPLFTIGQRFTLHSCGSVLGTYHIINYRDEFYGLQCIDSPNLIIHHIGLNELQQLVKKRVLQPIPNITIIQTRKRSTL